MQPLPSPPGLWRRLAGNFTGGLIFTFLFVTLLAFNVLQTFSLLLRPISPRACRALNRAAADTWWGMCDWFGDRVHGIDVRITGDALPDQENALLVANHQQMTDITVLFRLARRHGRLGDLKWFVKDVLKYVPGIGWGMLFLDNLFIRRDWLADRDKIARTFAAVRANRTPVWVVSFVEGTRLLPDKLRRSQEYARSHGLPVLQHLLTPRSKGFVATVQGLRGHIQAVYDVTIGYVGGVPTLWQWIKGYVREAHLHVRRFAIDELPEEAEALADWLHQRFAAKDQLLAEFSTTGRFAADGEAG